MSTWNRGSLTVETALLMPVVLLVWMGTVSLCLFIHDRAYLTAAAYEAAVTGSWEAVSRYGSPKGRAREKAGILLQGPLYGAGKIRMSVEEKGDVLSVSMEGGYHSYGGLRWGFHVTGSRKLCRPVSFIRGVHRARGENGQIGGGQSWR